MIFYDFFFLRIFSLKKKNIFINFYKSKIQYKRSWEVEGTKLRHLRIITPDSNDGSKIDRIGKTSNNILDEFSRTQDMMSEQCISKDKKEYGIHMQLVIQQE